MFNTVILLWNLYKSRLVIEQQFCGHINRMGQRIPIQYSKANGVTTVFKVITTKAGEIVWVSIAEIKQLQLKEQYFVETKIYRDGICLWIQETWVLSTDSNLNMRIVVEADCGEWGDSVNDIKSEIFQRTYWWPKFNRDLKEFIQICLHCIISRKGDKIPLLLATVLHGEKAKDVVHAILYIWEHQAGITEHTFFSRLTLAHIHVYIHALRSTTKPLQKPSLNGSHALEPGNGL